MEKRPKKISKPRCQAMQARKISADEARERLATPEELEPIDITAGLVLKLRAIATGKDLQ